MEQLIRSSAIDILIVDSVEALKNADNSPMARARREKAATDSSAAADAAEPKAAPTDLFDDDLPDDFSIEEDL